MAVVLAADAAVLFPGRNAHDARCAAHGRLGGAVYFLERALIAGRARAWWGVGLCLGFGMLSKYTIGLLGSSAFLFMLFDASARALAVALAALWGGSARIGGVFARHHLERPPRVGFLRVSNLAPPGRTPPVRAAQADRLRRGAADSHRCRGGGGCCSAVRRRALPGRMSRSTGGAHGALCNALFWCRWRCSPHSACATKSSSIGPALRGSRRAGACGLASRHPCIRRIAGFAMPGRRPSCACWCFTGPGCTTWRSAFRAWATARMRSRAGGLARARP